MHIASRVKPWNSESVTSRCSVGNCQLRVEPKVHRAALQPSIHCRAASASSDANGAPNATAIQPPKMLKVFNEMTKWLVSGAATVILVTRFHDVYVLWAILGSIVNAILNKVLKKLLKDPRPSSALSDDHGMPSSHASSLGFLSVYVATSLIAGPQTVAKQVMAGSVLALGVFMAWLRVASGYHTVPQVVVGYTIGSGMALGWQHIGVTHAIAAVQTHGHLLTGLYGATLTAVAAFAIRTLMSLRRDYIAFKTVLE